jgi:hypothetical protein
MKKLDGWMLTIFSYGFPIIVCIVLLMSFQDPEEFSRTHAVINSVIGYLLMGWLACSLYIGIRLVSSEDFRERTLTKLAMMKEDDEREEVLTGKATRTVFLANLGILLFALLLSVVTIKLEKIPPEKVVKEEHVISIGLSFGNATRSAPAIVDGVAKVDKNVLIVYRGFSISMSALIIFAILWQITVYNVAMRRFLAVKKSP